MANDQTVLAKGKRKGTTTTIRVTDTRQRDAFIRLLRDVLPRELVQRTTMAPTRGGKPRGLAS